MTRLILTTPLALPDIRPFKLYWDSDTALTVTIEKWDSVTQIDSSSIEIMRDITHILIRASHSDHVQDLQKDYVALITPETEICNLKKWVEVNQGRRTALEQFRHDNTDNCLGFVRPSLRDGAPHIFYRWRPAPTDIHKVDDMDLGLECVPLIKRRNFLRPATLSKMQRPADDPDTEEAYAKRHSRISSRFMHDRSAPVQAGSNWPSYSIDFTAFRSKYDCSPVAANPS